MTFFKGFYSGSRFGKPLERLSAPMELISLDGYKRANVQLRINKLLLKNPPIDELKLFIRPDFFYLLMVDLPT